ncbi:hypothetical protein A2U01_0094592, partial [Trifolium medium]|nr:hypothetical protein [Trifolium medium]
YGGDERNCGGRSYDEEEQGRRGARAKKNYGSEEELCFVLREIVKNKDEGI